MEGLIAASKSFSKPKDFNPNYGTAGFRATASLLPSTVFRCGVLMALRAMKTSQVTGICITASHNPVEDNGVKLVEPDGEMLCQQWETYANELASATSDDQLQESIQGLLKREEFLVGKGTVMIAYDTRPSSPGLAEAAIAGVQSLGGAAELIGLLTTPQLHWMVLQIDCANGVGAVKLKALAPMLAKAGLHVQLCNTGDGVLNGNCGSDFLQKDKKLPENFADVSAGSRCCSIDGDCDRLMYFTPSGNGSALLFDGDKIATLAALFIKELISKLPPNGEDIKVGIIQTAYANGSSSKYIREELGCTVKITPTGVKYLHEAAHHFDVGIYFEANGHGTVLFSSKFLQKVQQLSAESSAARDLVCLSKVINQAVGDAISGILLVEAALRRRQWGIAEWAALYTDLPSRQTKYVAPDNGKTRQITPASACGIGKVADRMVIVTTDAETKVAEPKGLQALIDSAVEQVPSGRSFVRPSGTEDVVRVYAEAASQEQADVLAAAVGRLVHQHAGGVGNEP